MIKLSFGEWDEATTSSLGGGPPTLDNLRYNQIYSIKKRASMEKYSSSGVFRLLEKTAGGLAKKLVTRFIASPDALESTLFPTVARLNDLEDKAIKRGGNSLKNRLNLIGNIRNTYVDKPMLEKAQQRALSVWKKNWEQK
jgi:hypothetical protein